METAAPQMTAPGTEIITVARDGSGCDRFGNAIYTTAIYRAAARRDGVITWRRIGGYDADRRSGKGVTKPMIARAKAAAKARGVEFEPGIRHGNVCR